jgi:ParB family chromosome partitioning protein
MAAEKAPKGTTHKPLPRKKQRLGRGLEALIPDLHETSAKSGDYFQCDLKRIHPNRYQPRSRFSAEDLQELSQSIRSQGIIQPLLVRRDGPDFELIAGERRLRAAALAGLEKVPVIIKKISNTELLEISIVENIQREDLNPMEEAEAYHRLIAEFNLTQEEAAGRVGKSRAAVANFLRLRNLPEQIKQSITAGEIAMGHARALLGMESSAQQLAAWRTVVAKGLSVRATEKLVRRLKKNKPRTPPRADTAEGSSYLRDLADNLTTHFGTKVQIRRRGQRGRLVIEFYSDEDLDRLLGLLKPGV